MLKKSLAVLAAALPLAACNGGNPLQVTRSACPAVGIVQYAGQTTLFSPPSSRDANAIDVTAAITNLRASCSESGDRVVNVANFDVIAQRASASGARDVTLPYFAVVVRGGDQLLSKQLGQVTLHFADGQLRTSTSGSARADVDLASASLPDQIYREITRKRKPGDPDASIDPMAKPEVREAVRKASFELLVGFQLDNEAIAYNIAK